MTIAFFLDYFQKVKYKIQLGVQKLDIKFYFDIFIHHKDFKFNFFRFLTTAIYLQLRVENISTVYRQKSLKSSNQLEFLRLVVLFLSL
jgi:hypothetical protein